MLDLSLIKTVPNPNPDYNPDTAQINTAEEVLTDKTVELVTAYIQANEMAALMCQLMDKPSDERNAAIRVVSTVAAAAALTVSAKYGSAEDLRDIVSGMYEAIDDAICGWQKVNADRANTATQH